ncbi:amylo-alpha-1,6-glucosidase [Actinoplanes sp. RD1]|uniref:amylo-alpha-1,6-glucosidase n=1 Tax=Actinoplanes sp. RD1 TaxID=3064538 RepID=UPI00274084B1|nr:amylo-alpha-1,6-glucosidase [Actinoplanes sp. RD1]
MPQSPLIVGPRACGSLSADGGGGQEWLVTDGTGGFATGTVAGLRTRRYHSLLTVADPATGVRHTALASLDLTLTLPSGARVPLHTHQWESGVVSPEGHRHLETFTLADGLPRWRWRVGEVVVERELAMAYGRPALAVVHRVVAAPEPVGLAVAAMCTWRDAHGERYATGPALAVEQLTDGVVVAGAYRISGPGWQPGGGWHLGAYHREEAGRGLIATEDLFLAGTFVGRLDAGDTLEISAWAGDLARRPAPATEVIDAAHDRARSLVTTAKGEPLALAADQFLVTAADGPDVVAGYPWFGSYLGDTMTAYEGLFLETGRADEGRELLVARTAAAVRDTARNDEPWGPHDSPDAPLWLVHAVDRHVARTGDTDLAAELAEGLTRMLAARVGPLLCDDELLRLSPSSPSSLSWMNASTGAGPVTPRIGKPVEINALWVNALAGLAELRALAGKEPGSLPARHTRARDAFAARFRAPDGWLYDVIDGPASAYPLGAGAHDDDASLRPNQLFAWSLPHAPLAGPAGAVDRTALEAIGSALLTPLGLRTLAPNEYGYQGEHRGGRDERDIAYHQGTVWPWLIGPYADARTAAGLRVTGLLTGLDAHLREAGLGSLSETADGDPPHRPTGSPFSARSVAEVLRVRGSAGCES